MQRWNVVPLLIASALAGCAGDPCDQDALGCAEGGEFTYDPACELAGPLDVTLGQGMEEFTPFVAAEEPILHHGPQGGTHLCLGFRVLEPALDYPQLKVTFAAELNDPERCAGDAECDPWIGTGTREIVFGPELPLDEQLAVEQTGLILIISIWPTDLERRVRIDVADPCGREGAVLHLVPAT